MLFREDLMNIARTTLSSKILSQHKDFFSNLAVDAVLRLVLRVFFRVKDIVYVLKEDSVIISFLIFIYITYCTLTKFILKIFEWRVIIFFK